MILPHLGSAHTAMPSWALCSNKSGKWLPAAKPRSTSRWQHVPSRLPRSAEPAVAPVVLCCRGRTVGASSRLLNDVLVHVYGWLRFDVVADPGIRDLVIARIAEPTSKADAERVLANLGSTTVSYRTIARHLKQAGPGKYRDAIAAKCFEYSSDCGGLSLLL